MIIEFYCRTCVAQRVPEYDAECEMCRGAEPLPGLPGSVEWLIAVNNRIYAHELARRGSALFVTGKEDT